MKKQLMAAAVALLGGVLFAFPTQDEVRRVAPVVDALVGDDLKAADAGTTPRTEVAAKIHGFLGDADTDAAKWLLLRHAFVQYAKGGDFVLAAAVMEEILERFPDIAPAVALALINRYAGTLREGGNGEGLLALRDDLLMRKKCASVISNPKASSTSKAEALCLTGQWRRGLFAFSRIKSKAGTVAERELKSDAPPSMEVADFWWDYESPLDVCGAFRAHAVEIYERCLEEDSVMGLRRKLAESRISECRQRTKSTRTSAIPRVKGGLYMVIDLNGRRFRVSYRSAAPSGGWYSEYKTRKIVLRRIDDRNGTYYAGVFAVTEAQWDRVMGCGTSNSAKPKTQVSYCAIRGDTGTYDWPTSNEVDANSFMGKLRQKTGLSTFDLPCESEWDFAAQAGVTTIWLCGNSETGLDDYAWYKSNSGDLTHEVGTRQANAWGLYDVHGNVWEWCLNRYLGGSPDRVVRGGSYSRDALVCSWGHRDFYWPSYGYGDCGFRLFCRPRSN